MDLSGILRGFNAPLNEEQAWAICHQHAKVFVAKRNTEEHAKGYSQATGLESIVITKDGEISIAGDTVANSERELVESFGRVLFEAIEYGNDRNDEKVLSPDLERLIERMTLAYDGILSEEDDEGYEEGQQSLDHGPCTLEVVIKICEEHLETPAKANEHYLAVCRALITEAVDLKSFLEKVSSAGESLKSFANLNNNNDVSDESQSEEFPKLNFTEWAHLWITVVSDLRFGVKLKKVEGYTRNVEYELTPYEILMTDIRQRNYSLKKVAIDGKLPRRVKCDAHDIILDFIKSRPTLKPNKNRKLRPRPPRSKSLHERLLEQIQGPPSPLRHVQPPQESPIHQRITMDRSFEFPHRPLVTSKSCDFNRTNSKLSTQRRLIKAPTLAEIELSDFSNTSDAETDSDDDSSFAVDSIFTDDLTTSTINDESTSSPFKRHRANSNPSSLRSSGTSGVSSGGGEEVDGSHLERPRTFTRNTSTVRRKKLLSVELLPSPVLSSAPESSFDTVPALSNSYTKYSSRNGVRRANSMNTMRSPTIYRPSTTRTMNLKTSAMDLAESPASLPHPTHSSSPLAKRDRRERTFAHSGRPTGIHRTLSDKRNYSPSRLHDRWKYPVECLELTVGELIHIRQVLARAELEKYQGQGELYSNLKKGKVCFNCRVRKFSVFWWACACQICKQKICSKCMRKVRTPTDEYLKTPVYTLSPSLNANASVDPPMMGVENRRQPNTRYGFDSKLSVLRERNSEDPQPELLKQQYRTDTHGLWGSRGRKMDVCEECCDLISRIIQTNKMATMRQSPIPSWTTRESSDLARFVFARPTSVADRLLRRSTSSASFMTSCMPAYSQRNNVGPSRSVQSLYAAVAK